MSAGHDHPGGHGCADTHRLLCELFNPETPAQRRAEIKEDIASCPDCLAVAQSESDVRAIVRDCCASTRAPEPLRQRIITSISSTTVSYADASAQTTYTETVTRVRYQ